MAKQSMVLSGCTVEEAVIDFRTLLTAFQQAAGEGDWPAWLLTVDKALERVEGALTDHQQVLHAHEQQPAH